MLGDLIESALQSVGVTSELVGQWVGKPCNCIERKQRLNALSNWAIRIMQGKNGRAKEHLEELISDAK